MLKDAVDNLRKADAVKGGSALARYYVSRAEADVSLVRRAGMSREKLNEYHKAQLDQLTSALEIDPNFPPALLHRALTYGELGEYGLKIQDMDRYKSLTQNVKDKNFAYSARSTANMGLGKTAQAISDLTKAIELRPRKLLETWDYEDRADAYAKEGEWDKAVEDLTTAISLQVGGKLILSDIREFRALYPEYAAASDEMIAHKLHGTFFPALKYKDFAKSFLHDAKCKGCLVPSATLSPLYEKRSDAYWRGGYWRKAALDYHRASKGGASVDRWREAGRREAATCTWTWRPSISTAIPQSFGSRKLSMI
jgi:tetratricopeptide (TPR) repeat protein